MDFQIEFDVSDKYFKEKVINRDVNEYLIVTGVHKPITSFIFLTLFIKIPVIFSIHVCFQN